MENETLILDLLAWLEPGAKPYSEVMSAWQTSCPRLSIWEDALDAGLLEVRDRNVTLTSQGRTFWHSHRGRPSAA
jgi:hypothetical protein